MGESYFVFNAIVNVLDDMGPYVNHTGAQTVRVSLEGVVNIEYTFSRADFSDPWSQHCEVCEPFTEENNNSS